MFENIAIVGATGAVGSLLREMLAARNFPYKTIKFLASKRSAGSSLDFKGKSHIVEELTPQALEGVDLAIASTPDDTALMFIPWAKSTGTVVIDESAAHRMADDVPLVIPEVNPHAVLKHQGIIASPNCSTTQMVVALKPLHDAARLISVNVCTYQATSGAGVKGNSDLKEGTRAALANESYDYQAFQHPIAFNLIPQIGSFKEEGYTSEELKMIRETHKILEDDSIGICPTCVRVPVENCHSEVITVETEKELTAQQAREILAAAPGIKIVDEPEQGVYPMPSNSSNLDGVYIGRIRKDLSRKNGITFWCVSDNLRKGAATNAVQIAELLVGHNSPSCATSN